jgi:hypothetical protein
LIEKIPGSAPDCLPVHVLLKFLFFIEYSHSAIEASQDSRQNHATPSFRELNKVQRQVFQPSVSVAHESSTSIAASQSQANQSLVPTEDEGEGYQLRQALSAGTQARVTDKNQVFLPGRNSLPLINQQQ